MEHRLANEVRGEEHLKDYWRVVSPKRSNSHPILHANREKTDLECTMSADVLLNAPECEDEQFSRIIELKWEGSKLSIQAEHNMTRP